jgi:hypothetical protein
MLCARFAGCQRVGLLACIGCGAQLFSGANWWLCGCIQEYACLEIFDDRFALHLRSIYDSLLRRIFLNSRLQTISLITSSSEVQCTGTCVHVYHSTMAPGVYLRRGVQYELVHWRHTHGRKYARRLMNTRVRGQVRSESLCPSSHTVTGAWRILIRVLNKAKATATIQTLTKPRIKRMNARQHIMTTTNRPRESNRFRRLQRAVAVWSSWWGVLSNEQPKLTVCLTT